MQTELRKRAWSPQKRFGFQLRYVIRLFLCVWALNSYWTKIAQKSCLAEFESWWRWTGLNTDLDNWLNSARERVSIWNEGSWWKTWTQGSRSKVNHRKRKEDVRKVTVRARVTAKVLQREKRQETRDEFIRTTWVWTRHGLWKVMTTERMG